MQTSLWFNYVCCCISVSISLSAKPPFMKMLRYTLIIFLLLYFNPLPVLLDSGLITYAAKYWISNYTCLSPQIWISRWCNKKTIAPAALSEQVKMLLAHQNLFSFSSLGKLDLSSWWVGSLRCLLIFPPCVHVRRCVSGKRLCSGCSQPLGKGAAMNIDTLGLFFHMRCFKVLVSRYISTRSGRLEDNKTCSLSFTRELTSCHLSSLRASAEVAVGRWAMPPPALMCASATVTWAATSATLQPGVSERLHAQSPGWVCRTDPLWQACFRESKYRIQGQRNTWEYIIEYLCWHNVAQ